MRGVLEERHVSNRLFPGIAAWESDVLGWLSPVVPLVTTLWLPMVDSGYHLCNVERASRLDDLRVQTMTATVISSIILHLHGTLPRPKSKSPHLGQEDAWSWTLRNLQPSGASVITVEAFIEVVTGWGGALSQRSCRMVADLAAFRWPAGKASTVSNATSLAHLWGSACLV